MRQVIWLLIALTTSFAAHANQALEERMYFLNEQAELFTQICFTADGTYKESVTHYQASTSIRETAYDCDAQLYALNAELDAINSQVVGTPGECEFAPEDPSVAALLAQGGDALAASRSCTGGGGALNCTGDIVRNFASAFIPSAIHDFGTGTNCFTTLLAGFAYSFYDMACSITSLFGYDCDGGSGDEEAASSDAATLAGVQTEPRVNSFLSNPLGWASDVFGGFINSIGNSIMERFGCADWEGSPYVSTCLAPMSWSCANCSQRTNMVCGVFGYIAGIATQEVLTGFLVGAVVGLSTRAALSVSRNAARYFPPSVRLGSAAVSFGARAAGRIGTFWTAFTATRPIRAISDTASRIGQVLAAGNRQARRIIVIAQGEDALLAAIRRFNTLSEQALMAGFNSTAGARLATVQRLESEATRVDDILDGTVVRPDGTRFESVEDYVEWRLADLPPEQRALQVVERSAGDGAQERITFSLRRDVDYNSDISLPATPTPAVAAADDAVEPEIVVTGTREYRVTRAEIPRVTTQLRERGIDIDNLRLPVEASVARRLNGDQRTLVLEQVLDRRLSSSAADDILEEVRWGNSGRDPGNFAGRRQRVEAALRNSGMTAEEASEAANNIFRSNLLGDVPPGAITAATPNGPPPAAPGLSLTVGGSDEAARAARAGGDVVPTGSSGGTVGREVVDQPSLGTSPEVPNFESINDLRTQLDGIARRQGSTVDELLNEIQRGTRSASDFNVYDDLRGIDSFIARHGITGDEATRLRATFTSAVRQRNGLTTRNTARDLERQRGATRTRAVDCNELNRLGSTAHAFHVPSGCREVVFDQAVRGDYCSCNEFDSTRVRTRAIGPWLTPCASMAREYLSEMNQADVTALPQKNGLNRCYKVDIQPGTRCFHGGLGPTFRGFGGYAQMYCGDARSPGEFNSLGPTISASSGVNRIEGARYAPLFRDERMNVITQAGRACLDVSSTTTCSVTAISDIRSQLAALRAQPGVSAAEINDADIYIEYLMGRIQMDNFGNLRCRGSTELATGICP